MRPFLSRRKRIRLAWLLGSLALAGGLAAVALTLSNTAARPPQQVRRGAARLPYRPPPTVALRGERRREALGVARDFIQQAVFRRSAAKSWDLAAPTLRRGYTRKAWATGTIPVVPFPAKALLEARWKVRYSYAGRLAFDVLFLTKPKSGVSATVFTMGLVSDARPGRRSWLVSSWAPAGSAAPTPPSASRASLPPPAHALEAAWLLVPAALGGVIVFLPLGLWLRGWRRGRRARRAYEAALPPLPRTTTGASDRAP